MITLSEELVLKSGNLNAAERKVMQQHTTRGADILNAMGAPRAVVSGARFHHERWDGTGYPYPMRGRHVPVVARVLAVADVYAALTSVRPYRRALTAARARLQIERNAGSQFDPELVARFFQDGQNGHTTP